MSVLRNRSDTAWLNDQDGLKKRRQQFERCSVNYANEGEEITRIQKLTVDKIKELQATSKKLSKDCNQIKLDMHVLKNENAAKREEVRCLESGVLELKKDIAVESEGQQQLRVTKIQAEADKEKFQKELMKRHEAFLKAMAYYKKKLHIRLRFEEGRLILHFLNIVTPEGNVCSLKLRHTDSKWSLLGTDPVLPSEKDLANKLETTQDIQGFISCVRKLFMQLSGKKKLSKKSRMCSS